MRSKLGFLHRSVVGIALWIALIVEPGLLQAAIPPEPTAPLPPAVIERWELAARRPDSIVTTYQPGGDLRRAWEHLLPQDERLLWPPDTIPVFIERPSSENPFVGFDVGDHWSAPSLADIDGDGDIDMVSGLYPPNALCYFENVGTAFLPEFEERSGADNPFAGVSCDARQVPCLVDLDSDGDSDVVCGDYYGDFWYFQNDGTVTEPDFVAAGRPFPTNSVTDLAAPAFGDLDADGDPDLIAGNSDGNFPFYLQTSGGWSQQSGSSNPFDGFSVVFGSVPGLADIDGDGDLDMVSGSDALGGLFVFENIGEPSLPQYVERTGTDNPFYGIGPDSTATPGFVDLDGDGDQDVVVGNKSGTFSFYSNGSWGPVDLFADGFESGDTSAWSLVVSP